MSEQTFPNWVWVVVEWPASKPHEQLIFAVYKSREAAISGYGEPADAYGFDILKLRVF